ncbi:MAG: PEP-CTERM sorting domain-containing protein [Phycisphaerales bacterium]|nr:MAG: PEP-CTERM sorting domain-containing protein [Phycisphaerales bacterium]
MLLATQPGQGGFVSPRKGVYSFEPDSQIILTAAPKPGYQFVCWLGDVSDRTAAKTIAYLDRPKIIVAVFERADYDILPSAEGLSGGRLGNGGRPGPPPIPTPGPSVSAPQSWPSLPKGRIEQIPEPSTFLLFALAAVMLRKKR